MADETALVLDLERCGIDDIALVGGKNASLGEMISRLKKDGIAVPGGFALTAHAYRHFIEENAFGPRLAAILKGLKAEDHASLTKVAGKAQALIRKGKLPVDTIAAVRHALAKMTAKDRQRGGLAVRSSATAEDLPGASFAGLHSSYLNIRGERQLLGTVISCYASLFTARAVKYREDRGFPHLDIALSVCVQRMVRSDKGCAGVCFTLEPESGFRDIVHISACWGLGENIVQGAVNPDEFMVFKKTFEQGKDAIISRKLGQKEKTMVYSRGNAGKPVVNTVTPPGRRARFCLGDDEVRLLARWAMQIEKHYGMPMDIEWARDGLTGEMFIVQARPETAHGTEAKARIVDYSLEEKAEPLATGIAIGQKIAAGRACVLKSPKQAGRIRAGDVLVTDYTNPDWDPVLKKAAAIVTNKGGRTSHASIVARELGAAAVVGTGNATTAIRHGSEVTVSCAEGQQGRVYKGKLAWSETEVELDSVRLPRTHAMLILGDPGRAFHQSMLPSHGIGLMRLEFVIANAIKAHPMALVHYDRLRDKQAKKELSQLTRGYADKKEYFIDRLSQAVATIAAAFYPREVIVRMSDFKSNEYANLVGGREFEPEEENPMLGFRGASRYYHDRYREGFRLECLAMKRVREDMGFENVKLMIPFCRTVEEGRKVEALMKQFGLKRGVNKLELYLMVEIPSNVLLLHEFARYFDGFSIGSNDLTQLTLGIDRDSAVISGLFDERNEATRLLISQAVKTARGAGRKIGLCGQAPSDIPEFAEFLVSLGISSVSFNADALLKGIENINRAEDKLVKDYIPV